MGYTRTTPGETSPTRASFRGVLRVRAFAVLYCAESQSIAGDQLARIALSVLVFEGTSSASLTALTYGATYLPAILGGFVLARVGDRVPRRDIMVACDIVRALLFLAMAISGLPLLAVVALLILAVFIGPAFSAAEVTYLSAVLDADDFRAANGLRMFTNQLAQAAGFAVGGVLVAFISPRGALVADAISYAVSAGVVGLALRRDERPGQAAGPRPPSKRFPETAVSSLWRDSRLRALVALSCLAGLFIVPEGLAVPFGSEAGASTAETGLLIASIPLGSALGAVLFVRLVAAQSRARVANWMAVGCGLPLIVTAFVSSWPLALGCWLASGALAAYEVEVLSAIVFAAPKAIRTQFVGMASALLLGAQGLGVLASGAVVNVTTAAHAVGLAGLTGSVLALMLVLGPLQAARRARHHGRSAGPRPDATESRTEAAGPYAARHR